MAKSQYLPLPEREEVFLDTETTGLDPVVNEVIEFAAIKRSATGQEIDRIELKVKALYAHEPPPWASGLPGFNRESWASGIRYALSINGCKLEDLTSDQRMHPDEAAVEIAAFIKNCTVIGQNPGFDIGFIEQMVLRAGLTQTSGDNRTIPLRLPYHKIDTAGLAYEHLRPAGLGKLSLSKGGGICEFIGIPVKNAHTAMGDVLMTMKVYDALTRAPAYKRLWWRLANRLF